MKTRTRALRWAGIAIGFVCLMWGAAASADPRRWGENGLAVRPLQEVYTETTTARSEDGHTLFVWSDARTGSFDLYAQLYDAQGAPQWVAGVPVAQHEGGQLLPAACAVPGGWIIAWIDMRDNAQPWDGEEGYTGGNIRAQKLNEQGAHLWDGIDPTGVPVYTMTTEPDVIQIVAESDGAGGALVAWRNNGYDNLGAQRILASGSVAWANPLALTDSPSYRAPLVACGDTSGNIIVGWREYDPLQSRYVARVTKISAAGTLPWGLNGRALWGNFDHTNNPQVRSDGANGCFIAWVDGRSGTSDIYAQRLNSDGNPLWADTGLAVCTMPSAQVNLRVVTSRSVGQADGLVLAWEDYRVSAYASEIYAQKVHLDGTAAWAAQGRKICGDATPSGGIYRMYPTVASDGQGGLVCAWLDLRDEPVTSSPSIYANRVRADSALAWQGETGVAVAQNISWGGVNALWANASSANCIYYTVANDSDYGLRRQIMNISDGARQLPLRGETVATGFSSGVYSLDQEMVAMTPGRTAILWTDSWSSLGSRVALQIVDTAGHFEKGALGTRLVPGDSGGIGPVFSQDGPRVCTDGQGGFFVIVRDSRTGSWKFRAIHINAQGNVASNSNGRLLDGTGNDQERAFCATDGLGGCYVAWAGYDANWTMYIRLTRLNAACEAMWTAPLEFSTGNLYDQIPYALVPNPDGGCMIISGDYYYAGPIRILITRVGADRTVLWQDQQDFSGDVGEIAAVEDHAGGLFVFQSPRNNNDPWRRLYAQHINERGEYNWGPQGLQLPTDSLYAYSGLRVAADEQLNLYLLYTSYRDAYQVHAQKITASGARVWGEVGLLLSERAAYSNGVLCADGMGGIVAVWRDYAPTGWLGRIMAKHINAFGAPTDAYWAGADGGMIFGQQAWNGPPSVAADGMGGFVTACGMRLAREATYSEFLYAQRIFEGPLAAPEHEVVPRAFALQQNFPNPFNPTTEIAFDIPRTERVTLAVFDVLGRHVQTLVDEHLTAGTHRIRFDGTALASGIYFYRLEAGEFKSVKKMVMVK